MELFDAFEVEDVKPTNNQMARLENEKINQARQLSNDLLSRMAAQKRPAPAGDGDAGECRPTKITITDREETMSEGEVMVEDEDDGDPQILANSRRQQIHQIAKFENCVHEVAYPINMEFAALRQREGEAFKTFPFDLDTFQLQAVQCIDNTQSVLVSAHTSAGKTVVALYAIAKALKENQRVIYTSPIKALSNQKYRELCDEFPDVGLVTGDVTLNPTASVVVMTTEILRSMLYRGAEIMREVGWVIFDEIHYMRDKERGVVWEEAIILLPSNVHHVFLSATIPNALQFAEWIVYLHNQPCHVVYTDYRPTPLQHFMYSSGGDGLYEVVDIKGNFREDQFAKAMSYLKSSEETDMTNNGGSKPPMNRKGNKQSSADVVKIIRTVKERDMLPCIIFSFSRKECEAYAGLLKDIDFNDDEEKRVIRVIFENAVDKLSEQDKQLPQIKTLIPFLLRGIGIHHSGLLPILKEVTEILFGEGLIKTLFATETFAMGLNMPAKTVLFTSARKFDGTDNRWINSGEYIQMSGRAGRRGKDDRGLVILMVDQQLSADGAKQIIMGKSDPLNSQFRLTYNMVLNLLRVPDILPTFILEKSFHQFQAYSAMPEMLQKLEEKKLAYKKFHVDNLLEIEGYYKLEKSMETLKKSIFERVLTPKNIVPYFNVGRMLKITWGNFDFGWTALVSYSKKPNPIELGEMLYIVEVAVNISRDSAKNLHNLSQLRPPAKDQPGQIEVVPFTFDCISAISTIRLKLPENLKTYEAKQAVGVSIKLACKRMGNVIPEIDPIETMKLNDPKIKHDLEEMTKITERYKNHRIRSRPNFEELYRNYEQKLKLEEEYKLAKANYKKGKSLLHAEELACRKRVLRRLQYCDEKDNITLKGRVACELSSSDELLLTEMIFGAAFNELSPQNAAALLSCFVFEERSGTAKINDEMSGYLRQLKDYAKKTAKIIAECKIEINEEEYVESFGPQMMDVVFNWCSGASFHEIVKNTDIFEGSIIRCMRRLELVLCEMVNAAKSYGETTLEQKFEQARTLLKRDIVFSASLYL